MNPRAYENVDMKNLARWLMVLLAIVSLAGCGGCPYSFTGSSVPPHLKTIGIPLFDDQSGFGEPNLRENFTNKLISLFQQDNSLEVADKTHADSILEGIIASVRDDPSVVSTGETVTKRRVTISVKVTYQDMKLRKKVWEREFSGWGDYEISSGLAERTTAIADAIQKLGEDILNATVSGW
ncbi:MAG: LPS assembly lipoprotein LptE [Bacteroidota bacterium]|jgi:hypothetical protein